MTDLQLEVMKANQEMNKIKHSHLSQEDCNLELRARLMTLENKVAELEKSIDLILLVLKKLIDL